MTEPFFLEVEASGAVFEVEVAAVEVESFVPVDFRFLTLTFSLSSFCSFSFSFPFPFSTVLLLTVFDSRTSSLLHASSSSSLSSILGRFFTTLFFLSDVGAFAALPLVDVAEVVDVGKERFGGMEEREEGIAREKDQGRDDSKGESGSKLASSSQR